MAGQTPAEAVQNFLDPIRKALSCVTADVAQVKGGYYVSTEPHGLTVNQGLPVRLKCDHNAALILRQSYLIVQAEGERGPWKVSTQEYVYEIEDEGRNRILAYHWHPQGGGKSYPHLHVGSGVGLADRPDIGKAHLPTGRVSIEEVIRWAIEECGVEPLRTDWEKVLSETQARFEAWRRWSHGGPLPELSTDTHTSA